ncbi:MAG: DUF3887 domain-containing protein [Oscillatoria sp. SIO1A7]|nr:DUF3887 domain-containing protein [Oscillatoria sp. SIO1A7]
MKKYIGVLLLATVVAGGSMPAIASSVPRFSEPQILAQAEGIAAIAEEFIDLLAKGDFSSALKKYNSKIAEEITPQALGLEWNDLVAETGPFKARISSKADSEVVEVTCEFEKGNRDLVVIFNDRNEIVGFDTVQE